jgi:hypothetical protein
MIARLPFPSSRSNRPKIAKFTFDDIGSSSFPKSVPRREPRADCTLGVVFAGGRPAEIDEQPIAEFLGNIPTETRDRAEGSLLVLCNHLPPLLGVELRDRGWRTVRGMRGGNPSTAAAAEFLSEFGQSAANATGSRQSHTAFLAEAAVGAVVVTTRPAAHGAFRKPPTTTASGGRPPDRVVLRRGSGALG